MAGSTPYLPYDVLQSIIECSKDHPRTLVACCLVNEQLHGLASSALYSSLCLWVGGRMGPGRKNTKKWTSKPISGNRIEYALRSASLPHNQNRYPGTYYEDSFGEKALLRAFKVFKRLESITFNVTGPRWRTPENSDAFDLRTLVQAITIVNEEACLRELRLNSIVEAVSDTERTLLSRHSLKKMNLIDHDEDILDKIPREALAGLEELQVRTYNWSQKRGSLLANTFAGITNNCRNLKSLTLGIVHMSLNEALFHAVTQLPHLQELCLEYWFHGYPSNPLETADFPTNFPPPRTLRSFTLRYKGRSEYKLNVTAVCKWIKHVISLSPIERLNFIPFYQPRTRNPVQKSSWDILTDHLADKHAGTLRSFDLRAAFVRQVALKAIFRKCHQLEDFSVATGQGSLMLLKQYASNLPKLTRARFELRTMKGSRKQPQIDPQMADTILQAAHLRRLVVNDDEWEGLWILEDGALKHLVRHSSLVSDYDRRRRR
ncbi:hypothetical protein V5O48_000770 [Marasmius crinis-equi]|uniref:F-box domain-containing protein n=1 Tax=Marasmius crinis-equi TaxID=585013 RepID=A0ABR3G0E6_9AGAR